MERCRRDADFRSKWMVEPIDDEQEQAQQHGDPARQGPVSTSTAEMDETRDRNQQYATEDEAGPQQRRNSRFLVQDTLISVGRQYGQLIEKLSIDWTRRAGGPICAHYDSRNRYPTRGGPVTIPTDDPRTPQRAPSACLSALAVRPARPGLSQACGTPTRACAWQPVSRRCTCPGSWVTPRSPRRWRSTRTCSTTTMPRPWPPLRR